MTRSACVQAMACGPRGQAYEEPIGRPAVVDAEGRPQCVALGPWHRWQPVEVRDEQLVQGAEAELHLRLDPHQPRDLQTARTADDVVEQGGLPNPGLPPQHEDPAQAAACRRQELF